MHPKASKHPLWLSGIQCSQPQRENITYNTQIPVIPEVPEIWRTLNRWVQDWATWRWLPAFTATDKLQTLFPVTSFPKWRNELLPSPGKKKGSYKEIVDENLDSLVKQAQCGDLNHHFLQLSHLTLTAEPHSCLSHSWSKEEEKIVAK